MKKRVAGFGRGRWSGVESWSRLWVLGSPGLGAPAQARGSGGIAVWVLNWSLRRMADDGVAGCGEVRVELWRGSDR